MTFSSKASSLILTLACAFQFAQPAESGWIIRQMDRFSGEEHDVFVTDTVFQSETRTRGTVTFSKAPDFRTTMFNKKQKSYYIYPPASSDPLWEGVGMLLTRTSGLKALRKTGKTQMIAGRRGYQYMVEDGTSEFWVDPAIAMPWEKRKNALKDRPPGFLLRCATLDPEGARIVVVDTVSVKPGEPKNLKTELPEGFRKVGTPGELYLEPEERTMLNDALGDYLDPETAKRMQGLIGAHPAGTTAPGKSGGPSAGKSGPSAGKKKTPSAKQTPSPNHK